jgi:hypothetical protein
MHRRYLSAFVLALAAVGIATASVGATGPQAAAGPHSFSAPVKVLGGQFDGLSMVVDSTNAVDIAATGRGGLWFITNRGGSWTHAKVLANPTNKSWTNPSIAIDGSDHVYIALERTECDECTPNGSDGVFLITDRGRTHGSFPSAATKVAGNAAGDSSIKAFGGRIYIAYSSPCSCIPGDDRPLYLKTSTNATSWTKSLITSGGNVPQLRVASNGHARVAYTRHDGLGYAVAGTTTGSFTSGKIPSTTGYDYAPLLALDSSGRARIVYENFNSPYHLRYDRQTAGAWGSPQNITNDRNGFGFDLDTAGTPKVAQAEHVGVRLYTLSGANTWTGTTISSVTNARSVVLRRAFNAKVDVAYTRNSGGIWVTHG